MPTITTSVVSGAALTATTRVVNAAVETKAHSPSSSLTAAHAPVTVSTKVVLGATAKTCPPPA